MFDALSDRFDTIFKRLRSRGRLGERDVDEILREIRLALLEADVNFRVVKGVVARIKEKAVGLDLAKSLSPAQQVIKIVHEELVNTLDGEMMDQVRDISGAVKPNYTFLVVDAMTGQDAVNVAESFHATLELDGVILTKLDGDARGGAALSVKEVVGRPIAFASTGEKLADFDQFHPDRLAGRILGMGDVLTLIEKAEQVYEKDAAEAAAQKRFEGAFTL